MLVALQLNFATAMTFCCHWIFTVSVHLKPEFVISTKRLDTQLFTLMKEGGGGDATVLELGLSPTVIFNDNNEGDLYNVLHSALSGSRGCFTIAFATQIHALNT